MLVYGAILGDIIGSPYEFDRGEKTKEFELFPAHARFTDDTVMTIAVAEALIGLGADADEEHVKANVVRFMRHWGRNYLLVGYGGLFRKWLVTDDPQPYSSFGNGAAMRVSSVGWLYDSLSRTREVARWTAEVTHDHPEGMKGAETLRVPSISGAWDTPRKKSRIISRRSSAITSRAPSTRSARTTPWMPPAPAASLRQSSHFLKVPT